MLLEYSIADIKTVYEEYNDDEGKGEGKSREADYDNIAYMENIVSEEIDKYNVNSSIIHIFPITISLSVLVLLSSYIILY
jgi:hypothetical protein